MAYLNGRVGQIVNIFSPDVEVLDLIDRETVDTTIRLKHVGIVANPGTLMYINGSPIKMGPTGIYELQNEVDVTSIKFAKATEAQIDYVY